LAALVADLRPVLVQVLGADKQLEIPTTDETTAGPDVYADADQVQQVLINLVANSRDATETGSTVVLAVEAVTLDEPMPAALGEMVAPGRYVRLSVADTGQGMDEDTAARIFDPFFTTKDVGQGTGLGLSMVYGTVKRHGGYIRAHSVTGVGTTMELYWPALAGAGAAAGGASDGSGAASSSDSGRLPGGVVLVAEDEPAVRELAERALEAEGYEVVGFEDGAAALAAMESGQIRPDLVVTDLLMPRMNGRQLSDAVWARWPEVPVLFMSGHIGEGGALHRMVPSGAAFLQKPFAPDELIRAVADLWARSRA
jgi:CheY-like chemotaxis protein